MRIQFLVAAHKEPAFLARLCERLADTPGAAVAVQWDCATPPPAGSSNGDVVVWPTREPCEWGTGAQLDALLDSMRLVAHEPFDWLVVLSGQDYPVRPVSELRAFLSDTEHHTFFHLEQSVTGRESEEQSVAYLRDRYYYRYRWVPQRWWQRMPRASRRIVGAGAQRAVQILTPRDALRVQRRPGNVFSPGIGTRARAHPFSADRPCRKGSDWFALSRPAFDDLWVQSARAPEVLDHFRRSYCPNEAFFHTLLLPEWEHSNAGHNLHYVRFVDERPHPEMVRAEDLDDVAASGAFFARKFDPTDVALLDRIDRTLLAN